MKRKTESKFYKWFLNIEKTKREIEIIRLQGQILDTVYLDKDEYNRDLQRLGDLQMDVCIISKELEGVQA